MEKEGTQCGGQNNSEHVKCVWFVRAKLSNRFAVLLYVVQLKLSEDLNNAFANTHFLQFFHKKSSLTTIINLITPVLGGTIVDTQDNLFFQGAGSLGVWR